MLTGKEIVLFGAGKVGIDALTYFGYDRVCCFVDNGKAGQTYHGKPVISFEELLGNHESHDVVISVGWEFKDALKEQCDKNGVHALFFYDERGLDNYKSNPEIERLEGIHRGERCFLVGNGPSLTAEDLTKLHENEEICFGCNLISKIFCQTPWRPDYYIVTDNAIYSCNSDMLASTEAKYKFFMDTDQLAKYDDRAYDIVAELEQGKGKILFFKLAFCLDEKLTRFSTDVSKAIYMRGGVMYSMIQVAAYLGFTELYLIGVDGNSVSPRVPEEYLAERRHFYKDDEATIRKYTTVTNFDDTVKATFRLHEGYRHAEIHAREHGIRIYNATRGGAIEAFERVDFDLLF